MNCEYNSSIECVSGQSIEEGPYHCNLCLVAMLVVEIRRLRVTGIQT